MKVGTRWKAPEIVAAGAVAFLLATNVFRAWTQPITIDEARIYNIIIGEPFEKAFSTYEAGNHVLQTLLSKATVGLFGLNEFTLRLPSVLGGLLFLVVCFRLARRLFGKGWMLPLAVLALGLNPFVLDYLSAARGYGLGLGFLMWSFDQLLCYFEDRNEARLFKASIGLGLAVASVLIFLYPAVALVGVAGIILVVEGFLSGEHGEAWRRMWLVVDRLAGPGLVLAFVIVVLPLSHSERQNFYYGASTLGEFVTGLVDLSWFHDRTVQELGKYLPGFASWKVAIRAVILPGFLLLVVGLSMAVVQGWVKVRSIAGVDRIDRALLVNAGTMTATLAMLVVSRHLMNVLYPTGRTGIYWAPLVTLAILCLAAKWRQKAVALSALAFTVVSVSLFAAGFTTTHYAEWVFNRYDRNASRMIAARHDRRTIRVGASWPVEATLNFYRRMYRWDWLEPVKSDPNGDFDYYYLMSRDFGIVKQRGLKVVFKSPDGRTALAEKP